MSDNNFFKYVKPIELQNNYNFNLSKIQTDNLILSKDTVKLKNNWDSLKMGVSKKVNLNELDFPVVLRTGRGYNVFGKYASVESLKQSVLDLEKLVTDGKVERMRLDGAVSKQITGESIRSYSNQMSAKILASGSIFGFGGSAETNFDYTRTQNLNNYFSTSSYIVKKYSVYVNGATNLKSYLKLDAKKMINDNKIKADTVFANYGHYVLVDSVTGGRVDYNITASSQGSTSFDNFRLASKADFNILMFKASASAEFKYVKNESKYKSDKSETLNTQGGEFSLNLGQFANDPQILSKWERTLEENGTLVDFGNTTAKSLIPIWELVDNQTRGSYLKTEFEKLNKAQGNKWPVEKYVTDIVFVRDSNEGNARRKCPHGYTLIDADLNRGAGGDYIYLTYKLGEANDAYTDFFMQHSGSSMPNETRRVTHNSNDANYRRIGTDLNKGAWGKYIYMSTTKANTMPPIKRIEVAFDNPKNNKPEWDSVYWYNTKSAADVNKGAGGKYIYIKYTR